MPQLQVFQLSCTSMVLLPHKDCVLKYTTVMQVRMEKELAPLLACVEEVKKKVASEKRVPSYGTLKEWAQARADMAVAAARGAKRGNGMLQPAQVEVDLSGRMSTQTHVYTHSSLLCKS